MIPCHGGVSNYSTIMLELMKL